jgi:hypothetical protein
LSHHRQQPLLNIHIRAITSPYQSVSSTSSRRSKVHLCLHQSPGLYHQTNIQHPAKRTTTMALSCLIRPAAMLRSAINETPAASLKCINQATNIHISLPNPRPQHVSPRIDRLIGSNRFLRCVLYGVEDGAASIPCSLTTTMTQQPSKVIKVRLETPRPRLMPNPRPEYVGASFHRLMARVTFCNSFFMASKGFSN